VTTDVNRSKADTAVNAEALQSAIFNNANFSSIATDPIAAAQQPITVDIILPNVDGWEFIGRLKQVPELRRIPVMIISIVADRNKGFALGAAAVMQKPLSRQELYDAFVPLSQVTATEITAEHRTMLSGYVTTIMEKSEFDQDRFAAEVRRAMSGRV
jgi:CheY-like chemotaxis protein